MHKLFAGTLLLSAALLFCVQPMIARMILPLLGGSPAVWNTCMVFFQVALLAGYLYAHALTAWLDLRVQVGVHLVLLVLPFLVLPFAISVSEGLGGVGLPYDANPVGWQLRLLVVAVGLPFFVVASTAPLLQRWFAVTGDPDARDPYFLYAASNVGSMGALIAYPLLLEPALGLSIQSTGWTAGYAVLAALIACCGIVTWKMQRRGGGVAAAEAATATAEPAKPLTLGRRVHWVMLAFVPSALMLAVTTYITTDVAAVPLLWVAPLAVYLLSFILVFAGRPLIPIEWMHRALPFVTLAVVFTFLTNVALLNWQFIPLHWIVLFIAAMSAHGQLAADRPAAEHLTEFYLWLSVGGVLGGMFAALVAPLLFQSAVLEYPLLLILACWLRPGPGLRDSESLDRWLDLIAPLGVLALGGVMVLLLRLYYGQPGLTPITMVLSVLTFVCFFFAERPTRFALATGAAVLALAAGNIQGVRTLDSERNFFGIVRVQDAVVRLPDGEENRFRHLSHGSTLHGLQRLLPDGRPDPACEPLSYFTRTGPIGEVFTLFAGRTGETPARVAVTGLGVGALASYARPNEDWVFYEIDPAIVRVAQQSGLFTFLANSRARSLQILVGDARLRMRDAPDASFDLIVLDAFSSDSVPTHLLTREALALYLAKLKPKGILAFNVSNRYLDIRPVLANLAGAAEPPLVCHGREDPVDEKELAHGKTASQWMVLARKSEDLGPLAHDPEWKRFRPQPEARLWTDDFSNIFGVLKWLAGGRGVD